ncbi:MAG: aminopeptidase P family N-terminal domain-containing protein [Eubacteriales bacterium]
MTISERIQALRAAMKEANIDAYIIPSADFHQSEYVGSHFKSRAFITGFTGSAGTAVITADGAYLWTDGRYFLQAEQQLEGTGVELCRMGNKGVPTTPEFITSSLGEGATLGFDGRVLSVDEGLEYETILKEKNGSIRYDLDLIDQVWADRPALSTEPAFHLTEKYTGASTESKLARIREKMIEEGVTAHIITSLDDFCWTFNFRGNDVKYSPLVLGYAIIHIDSVDLFVDTNKLNDEIKDDLSKSNVTYHEYNDIYDYVKEFTCDEILMIDPSKFNYALYKNLPTDTARKEIANPTILMKAMKNEVELDNIRLAHIKDGIAVTKYMRWVKMNVGKVPMTEMSASDKLEEFRAEQEGFLWPSFAPICAYKDHAAIVHYESEPETNVALKPEGLFLNDTGGNYNEGSTDITRTFALGTLTKDESLHFTTVARSMLSLANVKFVYGVCGFNLDAFARQPFWEMGLDYNHGTGHGVGYLLNIHEGPTGFRWRVRASEATPLEEGMILTDEPGLYIGGSHGIRTENELVVRKGIANEYGQFMYFEPITFAPIDLDAIDPALLTDVDKIRLNEYHAQVWEKLSPYLNTEEQEWLKEYTRAV